MSALVSRSLSLPVMHYDTGDFLRFGDRIRRRVVLWAVHLGDDVAVGSGATERAIGDGEVVFAKTLAGSEEHRSWGGVVIVRHAHNDQFPMTNSQSRSSEQDSFYSIYGHMRDFAVAKGDTIANGGELGVAAEGFTPENGWWKHPHLHFGIYTGPWQGEILPGYWRPEQFWRTKRKWWHDPREFIKRFNKKGE